MGNTLDGFGKPVYDDTFNLPEDLTAAVAFADHFANVRRGTSAERQATPPQKLREGMMWPESDTQKTFQWFSAVGWRDMAAGRVIPITTFSTGWSATPGYVPYLLLKGNEVRMFGAASRGAGGALSSILTIPEELRPPGNVFLGAQVNSNGKAYDPIMTPGGLLTIAAGYHSVDGTLAAFPLGGSWERA